MRTIVVTGASDGIGAAAAEQLAGSGDRLVLVGRSPAKTAAIADRLGVEHHVADFAHLDQVEALAERLAATCERIDVLANNAGGVLSGPRSTADGFEQTFQVNHLAPVLLTRRLLPTLLASRASVVATASLAALVYSGLSLRDVQTRRWYRPNRAYGNAKLANILFTKGLHERYHEHRLSAVAFHPGIVATSFASDTSSYFRPIYHGIARPLLSPPQQGGAVLRHFISGQPGTDWRSGEYYNDALRIGHTSRHALRPESIERHWQLTAQLLGIDWP